MRNRTKRTTVITLAVVAAILLVASLAAAQGPGDGRFGKRQGQGQGQGMGWDGDGPGMRLERMANRLDLSDDQQEAIAKLQGDARAASLGLRKEMMVLRHAMKGEMMKDEPNKKNVLGIADDLGDLRKQMQVNRLETRLAVRELLTPEQRDKMLFLGQGFGQGQGGGQDRGFGQGRRGHRGCCDADGPGQGFGRGSNRPGGRAPRWQND